MTRKTIFRLALLGAAGMSLAGCGGGNSNSSSATTAPVVIPLQAQFGTMFNTDYTASPNSEPVVPAAGDVIALNLTVEPIALH